jgi:hypothetical protein
MMTEVSMLYPGWRVVFACFAMAFVGFGFGFYGHSVYLAALTMRDGDAPPITIGVVSTAVAAFMNARITGCGRLRLEVSCGTKRVATKNRCFGMVRILASPFASVPTMRRPASWSQPFSPGHPVGWYGLPEAHRRYIARGRQPEFVRIRYLIRYLMRAPPIKQSCPRSGPGLIYEKKAMSLHGLKSYRQGSMS